MSTGYSVFQDGTVARWSGFGGSREKTDTVGNIDANEYHDLLSEIYALDPASIRQQQTDNMTTSLEIVSGDVVYVYTWPGLHSDDAAVPETVRELRNAIWKHMQAAVSNNE